MFFSFAINTSDCFTILVCQFIVGKNLCTIVEELFHLQALSMLVFTLYSIGFCFHSCSIMIADSQNVFMNGMKEDGEREGFPLSMYDYGVGIGEAQGLGMVMVGVDLR
jgi:hypothetical protein